MTTLGTIVVVVALAVYVLAVAVLFLLDVTRHARWSRRQRKRIGWYTR